MLRVSFFLLSLPYMKTLPPFITPFSMMYRLGFHHISTNNHPKTYNHAQQKRSEAKHQQFMQQLIGRMHSHVALQR